MSQTFTPRLKQQTRFPDNVTDIWDLTRLAVQDALNSSNHAHLISGIPGQGKTHNTLLKLANQGEDVMYATGLTDNYDQAENMGDDFGFDGTKVIPALQRTCPAAADNQFPTAELANLHLHGASAATLHREVGMPCHSDGAPCEYMADSATISNHHDQYQALVGHYSHLHLDHVTDDRVVVVDEAAHSSMVQEFSPATKLTFDDVVNSFLSQHDDVPYANSGDLVANRSDTRSLEAASALEQLGLAPDDSRLVGTDRSQRFHTLAPLLVYAVVNGRELANGWQYFDSDEWDQAMSHDFYESAGLDQKTTVAWHPGDRAAYILRPPNLANAKKVICLDAFPVPWLWELAINESIEEHDILPSDRQKLHYMTEIQEIDLVQVETRTRNPSHGELSYAQKANVRTEKDAAVGAYTHARFGKPHAITTKAGHEAQAEATNLYADHVKSWMQLSMVKSQNTLTGKTPGIVFGSNHPGNPEIKKWCAVAGESTALVGGEGKDKQYSGKGHDIYRHFVHHQVAQAIFRFRKGDPSDPGATVVVTTKAYPEWMNGAIVETWNVGETALKSDNRRQALILLKEEQEVMSPDLATSLGCSRMTAKRIRDDFASKGWVTVEKISARGNPKKLVWQGVSGEDGDSTSGNGQTDSSVTVTVTSIDTGDRYKKTQGQSPTDGGQTTQTVEAAISGPTPPVHHPDPSDEIRIERQQAAHEQYQKELQAIREAVEGG